MSRLLIVGAGGHGAVVAEAADAAGTWETIEFVDDDNTKSRVLDYLVVAPTSDLKNVIDTSTDVFVAIGDNRIRTELLRSVDALGARIATIVHPGAQVSPTATVNAGCVVMAGVVINARTELGLGVIVNTGATIDHDCVIGDCAHISPGANLAGGVHVGDRSWIGIGAAICGGVAIGSDSVVGAGAAVVDDVADNVKVGGVPARLLRNSGNG